MTVIMRGKDVADQLKDEIQQRVEELKKNNKTPKAAIVRVGDLPDSIGYERSATRVLSGLGIEVDNIHYPEDITEEDFLKEFDKINHDDDVDGILLLRPVPDHIDPDKISDRILPEKDIDGMSPYNIGKVLSPQEGDFVPCTPVAVMKTLNFYDIDLKGKDVAIVGHSLVVGRPLANLLASQNATVTLCHIDTKNTKEICKQADIVITATGVIGLITKDHVKDGAVVVDVGTSYTSDGKLRGDVAFDEVKDLASHITPVPGGIGAITTSILGERVVIAAEKKVNVAQ